MLREKSLYFFKLRNRRGVVLVPVITQALSIEVVSRTQIVRSACALHVFHHGVCWHDERESRDFLTIHRIAAEREQTDDFVCVVQHWSAGVSVGCGRVGLQ